MYNVITVIKDCLGFVVNINVNAVLLTCSHQNCLLLILLSSEKWTERNHRITAWFRFAGIYFHSIPAQRRSNSGGKSNLSVRSHYSLSWLVLKISKDWCSSTSLSSVLLCIATPIAKILFSQVEFPLIVFGPPFSSTPPVLSTPARRICLCLCNSLLYSKGCYLIPLCPIF